MLRFTLTILVLGLLLGSGSIRASERPNILWIVAEDLSPWIASYGDPVNEGKTPAMDRLAAEGVRFHRAFVSAPVCSPCRSGFIVGAMATTTGTHNHRSSRSPDSPIHLHDGGETPPLRGLQKRSRSQFQNTF